MKQFLIVLKFEMENYFKNKTFLLTTVGLALVAAALVIVPTFIPGFLGNDDKTDSMEELQEFGICPGDEQMEKLSALFLQAGISLREYPSEKELKSAVEEESVQAGFILDSDAHVRYVVNNLQLTDTNQQTFADLYAAYLQQSYYLSHGMTPEELSEAASLAVDIEPEILGKNSAKNYMYTYILIFAVYFLILLYGQMIAVSVTNEKSNRAIEILVTSVNSSSLICGKVLAGAISGVIQMSIILGAAFGSYAAFGQAWGGMLDFLFDIPTRVLLAFAVFQLLSYLLYAFIYGMLGAMVSKTEDISKSASTVTMLYVVSFLVAIFGMMQNSDSLMMKVASFIPFTSGNAMFIRVSMGSVSFAEILISFVILAGSCVGIGILAAKMFRMATLHYGNPLKLKNALKMLRQQS